MIGSTLLSALAPTGSLADPPASSVIGQTTGWLMQLLTGSAAAILATLAIAGIGFAMFSGRLDLRRGGTILLGCFLLFGGPQIARGLMASIVDSPSVVAQSPPPPFYPRVPQTALQPGTAANGYDPYAGASVPR